MIQYQVSRTRGGCPGYFNSVLCTETPHFCHQLALELVLSMENTSVWAHPLLLVSDWHKSCCKAGRKWVCSDRTCSATDHEHAHCSGVSPARANKMLLPRAFDSCKNRSSRNTGCQKHTRASKQLVDVRGRVRKYPENQGQLFSGTNNPATPGLQWLDWINVNMANDLNTALDYWHLILQGTEHSRTLLRVLPSWGSSEVLKSLKLKKKTKRASAGT